MMRNLMMLTTLLTLTTAGVHALDNLQTAALTPVATPGDAAPANTVAVPVLTHAISAGAVLADNDLTTAQVASKNVFAGTVHSADEAVGKQLTKDTEAGQPLLKMRLKEAQDVARDSVVQLVFRRPGMELTSQAKALQDGKVGESIRVMNPDTKTTLVATVTAAGQVEVR